MPDQLTPLDAMFLELEQADEGAHMHIGSLCIFEATADGPPAIEALRAQTDARLHALPRYRQRLSTPHVGGLSWPTWEAVEPLDIAGHVRRARLSSPGGEAELREWVADFWSHRLDRSRPLWETILLEGLEGGRWALATKTHHCLVDGVGSVDSGMLLLDLEREPATRAAPAAPAAAGEQPHAGSLVRAARAGLHAARHPRRLAADTRAAVELLVKDEVVGAARTSLGEPIGATRRFGTVTVELEEVKEIKRALGGTVNDVVLAVCTGGLRELLLARGETPPARGFRAQVPVNVRAATEKLALGNRVTSLFVELPVADSTALRRYRAVLGHALRTKGGTQARGGQALIDLTALAPPVIHGALASALFEPRLFNVTITNVPGPQVPLYAFGSRLEEILPLVPLFARHAVGVAVVSYDGRLCFGINSDRDGVPDLDVLLDGMRAEFEALQQHARRRARAAEESVASTDTGAVAAG